MKTTKFVSMINANELRIGNWVEYLGKPIEFNISFYDHDINPIPLTPEILEKAGFVYSSNESPNDDSCLWYYENKNIKVFDDGKILIDYYEIEVIIKHLHQLQNLYFALTGEELKINFVYNKC